jgi:ribosomal protein S18 acetylase RimI-like enzyme
MADGLQISRCPTSQQASAFVWLNIDLGQRRVGKIRIMEGHAAMTICSIQIFPEFQNQGLARKAVMQLIEGQRRVIADLVRPTAVEFWRKLGFQQEAGQRFCYSGSEAKQEAGV